MKGNLMKNKDNKKNNLIKAGRLKNLPDKKEENILKSKRVENNPKEIEKKYQDLFENMMDGCVIHKLITDKNNQPVDYVIEKINKSAEKILSWIKEDVEGKKASEVFNGDTPFIERYAKVAQTGKAEYFVDYYPGYKKWFEIRSFSPQKRYFVNVFKDITESKQTEEKIKHLNLVLRAIRNVNKLIVKEKNQKKLIKKICDTLIETRGYLCAWIVLLEENGKLKTYAEAGLGEDFSSLLDLFKKGEWVFCAQEALKQSKVVIIKDKSTECANCPQVDKHIGRKAMVVRLEYRGEIYGLMSISLPAQFINELEEQELFQEVAKDIAFSLHNMKLDEELNRSYQRLKESINAILNTISKIVESKDPYTAGHQKRVSQLAVAIAQEMKLPPEKIVGIKIASLIHDIGKIGIPSEIMSKPNKLTAIELNLIKEHAQKGYDILQNIDFPYPIAEIILQHHEKINGSGYPQGLKDDEILLEARIICVADVVEAMSSHRPYRPAYTIEQALEEISRNRGTLYDPKVVDTCLSLFKEKINSFQFLSNF